MRNDSDDDDPPPRKLDVALSRDVGEQWGLDVGLPESSTRLLVKEIVGGAAARARPPLRAGDRVVSVDGAACRAVANLEDVLPRFRRAGASLKLGLERPFRGDTRARPDGSRWARRAPAAVAAEPPRETRRG